MEEELQAADTVKGEFRSNPPRALAYRELIHESLYEFYAPSIGTCPEVQVVFFHGVEPEYSRNAFLDTWKSSDGAALWPTWLADKFPNIRLLSVSYDCSAIRNSKMGIMDLYCSAENVIQDLVYGDEGVGKHEHCPIVMVGKDLGCSVIQAVCVKAKDKTNTHFLDNVKGFVFYCPQFMGPSESSKKRKFSEELAMKLEGGDNEVPRNHHEFSKLQKQLNWVAWVMVAANKAGNGELLKDIPEASSRFGDEFYTAPDDIITICRPHIPTSISFFFPENLIIGCLKSKCTVHECQGLPTHSVGLMKKARELEESLKGTSMVVGITGMGDLQGQQLFNNTDLQVWTETIEKLGRADSFNGDENDQVWRKLRVSYDALAPVQKEMFLDVATFFFNEVVEEACATWKTEYEYGVTGWMHLVERGLVKSIPLYDLYDERDERFDNPQTIWMHEHFRDLGKRLSGEDRLFTFNKKPNTRIQIQLPIKEGDEYIPRHYRLADQSFDIPEAHLKHLKYLELDRVRCEGGGQIAANNLHFLRWRGGDEEHANQFPFRLEAMKTLSVLEVGGANFDKRQPLRLPDGLRRLWLYRIRGLDRLPDDLGTLAFLEVLNLCTELSTLPENFGALRSLKELHLDFSQLQSLPNSFGRLTSLEILESCLERLERLPDSFCELSALKKLRLETRKLQSLPERFHLLAALQRLEIWSDVLERLPDNFGELSALKELNLSTNKLQSLPERFHLLAALQRLRIVSKVLERLPDTFCEFSALKKLTLWLWKLQSLPERFHLPALDELFIKSKRLVRLPNTFDQLSALRIMFLYTKKLQSLPERFHLLTTLDKLVFESDQLERLPDTFGQLSALETLMLYTEKLQSLPERFHLLTTLHELEIYSQQLERLPNTFGQLSALKKLMLRTFKLQSLPERFHLLTTLRELEIKSKQLERLPDTFGQLSALKKLTLTTFKLQSLPERFDLLTALHRLEITSKQLERLPDTFGQLPALKKLTLWTPKLQSLPERFHQRFKYCKISRDALFEKDDPVHDEDWGDTCAMMLV